MAKRKHKVHEMAKMKRDTKYKHLNESIYRFLEEHLKFRNSYEQKEDIKSSVNVFIEKLFEHVERIDKRFKLKHKLLVGSMADNTRIIQPNEFDFLVVLNELSSSTIELQPGCADGFCHIKLIDADSSSQWFDMVHDNVLTCTNERPDLVTMCLSGIDGLKHIRGPWRKGNTAFKQTFFKTISKAISSMPSNIVPVTEFGRLMIKNEMTRASGPAITVSVLWVPCDLKDTAMEISIDIVPAIEITDIDRIITRSNLHPTLNDALDKTECIHLVPTGQLTKCIRGQCFQIVFTQTEVTLMKDLDTKYTLCYKMLKCLFPYEDRYCKTMVSYVWKTLVLKHALACSEDKTAADCILTILKDVKHRVNHSTFQKLRSLFVESHNILEHKRFRDVSFVQVSNTKKVEDVILFLEDVNEDKKKPE